jgi:hypothetical protein
MARLLPGLGLSGLLHGLLASMIAVAMLGLSASSSEAQAGGTANASVVRNPPFLRATQVLGPVVPGAGRRVHFEWEPVPGSAEYVLTGRWTDGRSWAMHQSEYRVTTRNASSWQARRVTFDVSLPEGNHSWKLVALFGPSGAADFESPAQLSFDVK